MWNGSCVEAKWYSTLNEAIDARYQADMESDLCEAFLLAGFSGEFNIEWTNVPVATSICFEFFKRHIIGSASGQQL